MGSASASPRRTSTWSRPMACAPARPGGHRLRHVDPDCAPVRSDGERRQKQIQPGAAADVDHGRAGRHRRNAVDWTCR
jgi:hypothetical protein